MYRCEKSNNYKEYMKDIPLLKKVTKFGDDNVVNVDSSETETPFQTTEVLSWNKIPWVEWKYTDDNIDALQPIKCFIDIMDINLSDLANNIDDIQDCVWVLENYTGQSIKQFMEDLKIKKAINLGEDGKAESKTTEIPTEARDKLYEKCEKNIYRFGRGLNFADRDNLGNASGVALKWGYGPLDEKADDLEENGHVALDDLFNLLFTYLNATNLHSQDFDSNDVKFIFDRAMIVNEKEQVEMVEASTDIVSRKTALSHHPFVEDAEEEIKEIDKDANAFDENTGGDDSDDVDDESEETEQESKEDKRQEGNRDSKQDNKDVQK